MKWWGLAFLSALALGAPAAAVTDTLWVDSFDHCRLRVLSGGHGSALVFVPGWTMTAEIWQGQMEAFAANHRVISFDPRGQGQSSKPPHGYDSRRRGRDIHALLSQLNPGPAVLVGWSLGAVDVVNYLQLFGSHGLRGVVLVDNSVDRNYSSGPAGDRLLETLRQNPYDSVISDFVPSIFHSPPSPPQLAELIRLSMETPPFAAREALAKASTGQGLVAALSKAGLPVLYAVTPRFEAEAARLAAALGPSFRYEVFRKGGHALFIDEAPHFSQSLRAFIQSIP
jgi:non-heme chloroperoxidase